MSERFDKFSAALDALCKEYGVCLDAGWNPIVVLIPEFDSSPPSEMLIDETGETDDERNTGYAAMG